MGREDPREAARGDVELEAAPRDLVDVGVEGRHLAPERGPGPGADPPGGARAQAVGADDEARAQRADPAVPGADPDPADPAGVVADQAGDAGAGPHVRAGLGRGGHEQPVERGPARRDQQVHPGPLLHRQRPLLAADRERDLTDRRRPGREHPVQQAPAGELDDSAAGDRVGGQGVARQQRPLEHGDVVPPGGQQPGGGGAGAPGTHDHDVVVAVGWCVHGGLLGSGGDRFVRSAAACDGAAWRTWRRRGGLLESPVGDEFWQAGESNLHQSTTTRGACDEPPHEARRAVLDRAVHPRHRRGRGVLRRAVRLDRGRGLRGVRGLPDVPARRPADRGPDAERRHHGWPRTPGRST